MREIKFRGYNKNYGWVYGSLNNCNQNEIIISCFDESLPFNSKIVLTESVGQFTGLKDKNGVDIYEGDIIKRSLSGGTPTTTDEVYYYQGSFMIGSNSFKKPISNYCTLEVIGNIHENPELLAVPTAVL